MREVELNDYIKKSQKYQEILNINDNKKKRLPTLNAKIGEVIKKAVVEVSAKNVEYSLTTVNLKMEGWRPESREGHTLTVYRNYGVVMGGHCSAPYSMAQVFNFDNGQWGKQFPLSSARSYHSSILYKGRFVVVFGGMGSYDVSRKCRLCFNSINLIDLQTWTSRQLRMTNEENVEARRSHGALLMGKYMLIFGGMNTRRQHLQDFVYLDLKELRWYEKEYKVEGRELAEQMQTGLAKHKMIGHFRSTHKNLPLYSSEYNDSEGAYIFGGQFGNTEENTLLFLGFNKYNPYLKKLEYGGMPPSSTDPLLERLNDNVIAVISGEMSDRNIKLFRIKEKEFVGIHKFVNPLFLGGLGSTLSKYDDHMYLFFGLAETGYVGGVYALTLNEKVITNEGRKKKDTTEEVEWHREKGDIDSESSNSS